jgi:hypothetical protein
MTRLPFPQSQGCFRTRERNTLPDFGGDRGSFANQLQLADYLRRMTVVTALWAEQETPPEEVHGGTPALILIGFRSATVRDGTAILDTVRYRIKTREDQI